PGSKQAFLMGFLEHAQPLFHAQEEVALHPCERCGQPTTTPLCAFCRLREEVARPLQRRGRGRRAKRWPGPRPTPPAPLPDREGGVAEARWSALPLLVKEKEDRALAEPAPPFPDREGGRGG